MPKTKISKEEEKFFGPEATEAANELLAQHPEPEPAPEPEVNVEPEQDVSPEPEQQENEPQQQSEEASATEGKQSMVPHAAMHAERQARKAAEDRESKLQQELKEIREAMKQAPQDQPKQEIQNVPDPDVDPVGYLKSLGKQVTETNQQLQAREQMGQLTQRVLQAEHQFKQTNPDYLDATQYLARGRAKELELMGVPRNEIVDKIQQESFGIAAYALNNGMDPAALAYNLAVSRGYARKAAEPVVTEQATQTIDRMANAQSRTRSLSSGSGSAPNNGMSIEKFNSMTPEEIASLDFTDPRIKAIAGAPNR